MVTTTCGVRGKVADWWDHFSGMSLWSGVRASSSMVTDYTYAFIVEYAYRAGAAGLAKDDDIVVLFVESITLTPWGPYDCVLVHDSEILLGDT